MRVLPIALVCLVCPLAAPALAAKVTLSGQVTYRERIALPEGSTLEIKLIDQTLPNLPPRLDVEAPVGTGQVPLGFNLSFDGSLILPEHSYALIAAISAESGLLFRNFEPYPVDPLAPAAPILIVTNLVGHVQTDPAASSQAARQQTPAVLDVIWKAVRIKDAPVLPRTTPSISISSGDMRAGGSTGCNSWFAPAQIKADTIQLGSITTTLKACLGAVNDQEQAFKDALAAVATWQVAGDQLTLFAADGSPLLVFER